MIEFDARAVAFERDEDLEVDVLVLAEEEDGSGRRLELQRALVVTDDDRKLGMDTYSIGNEMGATHYGGIEAVTLDANVLELRLDDEAADVLEAEGGYRIRLPEPAGNRDLVQEGLRAILGASEPGSAQS